MKTKSVSCDYLHMTSTPVNTKVVSRVGMASPGENSQNLSKIYISCCSALKCSSGDSTCDDWEMGYDKSSKDATLQSQTTPPRPEVPRRTLVRIRSVEQIEKGVVETLQRERADEEKRNEDLIKRLTGSLQSVCDIQDSSSSTSSVTPKDSRWKRVKTNLKSIRRLLHKESSSSCRRSRPNTPFISEPFSIPAGTETPTKLKLLPLKVENVSPHDSTDQGMDSGCFVSPDVEFPRTVFRNGKQCTFC